MDRGSRHARGRWTYPRRPRYAKQTRRGQETHTGQAWSLGCCAGWTWRWPVGWHRSRPHMRSSTSAPSSTTTRAMSSARATANRSDPGCRRGSGPASSIVGDVAPNAVEVEELRKSYGAVEAVRGISFTVAEGEVFALLGANGAGKTPTAAILEGVRRRDGRRVSVLGFDPAAGNRKLKEQMGIVLQTTGVDPYLTVAETVDMFRGYYPNPRPRDQVIEQVGLTEKSN